jgi:hypothetical protein
MRRNILLSGLLLLAAATAGSAQTPPAKPPMVTIVIVLKHPDPSPANVAKLVAALSKARTVAASLHNPGKARLYASTYAGDGAGDFIVTVEFPNLQALAEAEPRMQASAEWQQVIGGLMASGFKPVSQSLVTEVPY